MATNNLASNLKALRTLRGMSQEYLAEEAGISLRTVQRIEKSESAPTGETIKRLSTALDVELHELVGSHIIPETNTIKSTIIFLKKKRSATKEASEIKPLDHFIELLNTLKEKELSLEQTQGIESYIKYLELEKIPSFSTELFKSKLGKFKTFLRRKLKFVPNNHYTRLSLSFTLPFIIGYVITSGTSVTNKLIVCGSVSLLVGIGIFIDLRMKKQERALRFLM